MPSCASFFAGVGGIDLAFKKSGLKTIFANELDFYAAKTYKQNFSNTLIQKDIRLLKNNEIPNFDIMLGGFPCQAFSISGKREGFNDEKGRGNLFFELERIFKIKKPAVLFFENVKNLVTHDHNNTLNVILSKIKKAGYHVKYKVLNAYEYGNIPQNRERVYIVAFLDRVQFNKFEFPDRLALKTKIVDFLEHEENINQKYFYTPKTKIYNELVLNVKNPNTLYQWRRTYVRENKHNLCPTLTANMGTGGHNVPILNIQGRNDTIRKLTPRECFNLQGFPFNYNLEGVSDAQLYKQAGNSVVVPVVERIAKNIKSVLLK